MQWYINKSRPICPQICEMICVEIISKKLLPKEKVYSVRELALEIGVNPNTVQKAYDMLEEQGVIYSVRGSGWFVSEDISSATKIVEAVRNKIIKEFILEIEKLGLSEEQILKILKERLGENNGRFN